MFILFFLFRKMTVFNIVLFFTAIVLGILLLADSPDSYLYGKELSVTPTTFPTPTFTPTPTPYPKPINLIIPKLNISAPIEYVGVDEEQKMEVPTIDSNVAWYSLGFYPGEKGNAVIAGHLDTQIGPSIFYNLAQLKQGDEVFVTNDMNIQQKFIVREVVDYHLNDVPLDAIFGSANTARLNLITCAGWFNQETKLYSHRTVVYTELVK